MFVSRCANGTERLHRLRVLCWLCAVVLRLPDEVMNNSSLSCVRRRIIENFHLQMWLNVSEDVLYSFKKCWKLIIKSMNDCIDLVACYSSTFFLASLNYVKDWINAPVGCYRCNGAVYIQTGIYGTTMSWKDDSLVCAKCVVSMCIGAGKGTRSVLLHVLCCGFHEYVKREDPYETTKVEWYFTL